MLLCAATPANDCVCAANSLYSGSEKSCQLLLGMPSWLPTHSPLPKRYSCSGCGTGSGRSRIAFSKVKIAVFAPIPSVNDSSATAVNPGLFASARMPMRTSCSSPSTPDSHRDDHTWCFTALRLPIGHCSAPRLLHSHSRALLVRRSRLEKPRQLFVEFLSTRRFANSDLRPIPMLFIHPIANLPMRRLPILRVRHVWEMRIP